MATVINSQRWTSSNPAIYITATCTYSSRTSTTVVVHPVISISAVSGSSYFGYNIRTTCRVSNYNSGEVTIKNNSPNKWSSALSYDFGPHTVNASASTTSLTIAFDMASNAGSRNVTYTGTLTIPVGNTAPTWPSGRTFSLNYTGTIPENTGNIRATTSGATDAQGNTITYRFRWYRSGTLVRTQTTTNKYDNYSFSNLSAGQTLYAVVDCKDYATDWGSDLTSNTITKNTLTGATLSVSGSIGFGTSSISLSRTGASNTNNNTTFTYTLSSSAITVYNSSWSSSSTTNTLTIYRSGTLPTGAYIKFSDIKTYLASENYTGTIPLTLTTTNAYGTSKTSSANISVDIRQYPTAFSLNAPTGTVNINGSPYYIINQRTIGLSWSSSTDPVGTAITYKVEYSINGGTWTLLNTYSSTSATFPTRTITSTQKFKFRVTASTAYGYTRTITQSDEITLHYFDTPTIENIVVNRNALDYTVNWRVKQNTSISNTLVTNVFRLYEVDGDTQTLIDTITINKSPSTSQYNTPTYVYSLPQENAQRILKIAWTDTASTVLGLTPLTEMEVIPRYNPIFSIREKGVGVRAVAGDGTTFMIRSNPHFQLDGDMIIGGFGVHPVIYYNLLYVDAAGTLRAAADLTANQTVTCLVFNASGVQRGTNTVKAAAVKDAEVTLNNSKWTYTTVISI